jgi:hypothetical protein
MGGLLLSSASNRSFPTLSAEKSRKYGAQGNPFAGSNKG